MPEIPERSCRVLAGFNIAVILGKCCYQRINGHIHGLGQLFERIGLAIHFFMRRDVVGNGLTDATMLGVFGL